MNYSLRGQLSDGDAANMLVEFTCNAFSLEYAVDLLQERLERGNSFKMDRKDGLWQIVSTSSDGEGSLVLTFGVGAADVVEAISLMGGVLREAINEIEASRPELPGFLAEA